MIYITAEMKEAKAKRLAQVEARVDRQIQKAIDNGYNYAYFACDKDIDTDVYEEIRSKYESAGYKIKPTGKIGGVWQLTEDIYW